MDPSVPRSKRLLTDDKSNIFVYMTGHGGNEFLKFQDNEEISAYDIADAFEQMWQKKRCVCSKRIPLFRVTECSLQIQRDLLHDRHLPGQHHVLKVLLAKYTGHRLVSPRREFVLGR